MSSRTESPGPREHSADNDNRFTYEDYVQESRAIAEDLIQQHYPKNKISSRDINVTTNYIMGVNNDLAHGDSTDHQTDATAGEPDNKRRRGTLNTTSRQVKTGTATTSKRTTATLASRTNGASGGDNPDRSNYNGMKGHAMDATESTTNIEQWCTEALAACMDAYVQTHRLTRTPLLSHHLRQFKTIMRGWIVRAARTSRAREYNQSTTMTTPTTATAAAQVQQPAARQCCTTAPRTVRQCEQRHLPHNRLTARMVIQEAAASAASYRLSKGQSTATVDDHFIYLMNRIHNHHTPITTNTQRTNNQPVRFSQKRRRAQHATAQQIARTQPRMIILRTLQPGAIQQWRLALADFTTQARQYRATPSKFKLSHQHQQMG